MSRVNDAVEDYFAQERLRDTVKRAFDSARPPFGVQITGFDPQRQPDSVATTAYKAILKSQLRTGTVIDYELSTVRNSNFEELFQNQEARVR
jgi:hypothetical protein